MSVNLPPGRRDGGIRPPETRLTAGARSPVGSFKVSVGVVVGIMLAAGTLVVGCLGATAYSAAVGTPAAPVFLAGAVAVLFAGYAMRQTRRLALLRAVTSLIGLALLLWPVAVHLLVVVAVR